MTSSVFDNICTLPLSADLFAQAVHPGEPLLVVGLSSGYVQAYKLPPADDEGAGEEADSGDDDDDSSPPPPSAGITSSANGPTPIISQRRRSSSVSLNGLGSIDTVWKTKRHKGSCRTLTFNHDGSLCYSAGTDGIVKCFQTETGRVVSKTACPSRSTSSSTAGISLDTPCIAHALSPQALLLGTDSGRLCLFDLRQGGSEMGERATQTWTPHGAQNHVNDLIPLPVSEMSTSGFSKQWLTVGGTTLAVTDVRKGVIATSEDQAAELTSVTIVQGLKKGGTSVGEKVLVGQGDGILSLWERGVWGDLDERITVDRDTAGVEALCQVPLDWARSKLRMNEKMVAAGLEDGRVRFVRIGRNGVLHEWDVKHDEVDGVVALDFDVAGRMVSGGGQVVKVWTEAKGLPGGGFSTVPKRGRTSDDSSDDDEGSNDEDDDDSDHADRANNAQRRRKRKRNKGKDKSGGKALNFTL